MIVIMVQTTAEISNSPIQETITIILLTTHLQPTPLQILIHPTIIIDVAIIQPLTPPIIQPPTPPPEIPITTTTVTTTTQPLTTTPLQPPTLEITEQSPSTPHPLQPIPTIHHHQTIHHVHHPRSLNIYNNSKKTYS